MGTFGYPVAAGSHSPGTPYPVAWLFGENMPTICYQATGLTFPNWPSSITWAQRSTPSTPSLYCTYGEDNRITTIHSYSGTGGAGTVHLTAAITDADGNLLAEAAAITFPGKSRTWRTLTLDTPITIPAAPFYVAVWMWIDGAGFYGPVLDSLTGDSESWTQPPPAPGPSGSAGGPLFTGGGML